VRSKTVDQSTFGVDTGPQPQTLLSVEREIHNTYMVVRLTFTPAIARWMKRFIVGLAVWVTAAMVPLFTSTFGYLHL
jgi:hypothetical protein